jgi:hypothetical protein
MSLNTPKKRFFCSGVPVARIGGPPRPGPGTLRIIAASAHASSSAPIGEVVLPIGRQRQRADLVFGEPVGELTDVLLSGR